MDVSLSTLMDLSLEQQQQQQQHDQQDGTGKSLTNHDDHDSIDGAALFQENGPNKRIKISPTNSDKSCSFFADLNDSNEPSHQDAARRNKFAERRRKRTEKHAMSHAKEILSLLLQIEAEEQAPENQQVEFVAAINRSSANSSSTRRSAERHHLAVALDILSELDDDDADDE